MSPNNELALFYVVNVKQRRLIYLERVEVVCKNTYSVFDTALHFDFSHFYANRNAGYF
jgi:hypothetical protein